MANLAEMLPVSHRPLLLITGRLGFDFGCLLAALRATGAHPQPSLVLLAYSAAGILALFPHHPRRARHRGGKPEWPADPGGRPPQCRLPGYRAAAYWLPLLAGPPAYLLFLRRYGTPPPPPVDHLRGTNWPPARWDDAARIDYSVKHVMYYQ